MEISKEEILTKLFQIEAYLDIFGAKMIDEGQKEQAAFIAKVYQTVDETIRFIAGNTASDGEVLKPDVVDKPCRR